MYILSDLKNKTKNLLSKTKFRFENCELSKPYKESSFGGNEIIDEDNLFVSYKGTPITRFNSSPLPCAQLKRMANFLISDISL